MDRLRSGNHGFPKAGNQRDRAGAGEIDQQFTRGNPDREQFPVSTALFAGAHARSLVHARSSFGLRSPFSGKAAPIERMA